MPVLVFCSSGGLKSDRGTRDCIPSLGALWESRLLASSGSRGSCPSWPMVPSSIFGPALNHLLSALSSASVHSSLAVGWAAASGRPA